MLHYCAAKVALRVVARWRKNNFVAAGYNPVDTLFISEVLGLNIASHA